MAFDRIKPPEDKPAESNTGKRRGIIFTATDFDISQHPELSVVREHLQDNGSIEYIVDCEAFDELAEGEFIPVYEVIDGGFKRQVKQ